MHDIVEDIVDELIVKTKTCKTHLESVCKVLDKLLEYNIRLIPKKCAFGILLGKLFEFIISKRGIEVDPNKVHATNEMSPLKILKHFHSLHSKIQTIRRFIT